MTEDTRIQQIREAVQKYFAGPDEPAWCGEDATNKAADDGYAALERIRAVLDREPLPGSETERPRRCPAFAPEGDLITEGRQCQQYEGHAHDHTWYGDNGHAYSTWSSKVQP